MKIQILLFSLFVLPFAGNAQNADRISLDLPQFTSIELMLHADVVLTQGKQQSVELVGPAEFIHDINKSVKNNTWQIYYTDKNHTRNSSDIKIYVTMVTLDEVAVTGDGHVKSVNTFSGNELDLSISGSGKIELQADVTELELEVAGSGEMILSGNTQELELDIDGSGKIKAGKLKANRVDVEISGSGKAEVHANQNLDAKIAGSGKVKYSGSPSVQSNVNGSGSVEKI